MNKEADRGDFQTEILFAGTFLPPFIIMIANLMAKAPLAEINMGIFKGTMFGFFATFLGLMIADAANSIGKKISSFKKADQSSDVGVF